MRKDLAIHSSASRLNQFCYNSQRVTTTTGCCALRVQPALIVDCDVTNGVSVGSSFTCHHRFTWWKVRIKNIQEKDTPCPLVLEISFMSDTLAGPVDGLIGVAVCVHHVLSAVLFDGTLSTT